MHSFWSDNMNEKQKQYQSAVKKRNIAEWFQSRKTMKSVPEQRQKL